MATAKASRQSTVGTPYKGPFGTPLSHVGYQEARHMNPDRIPYKKHERAVSLHLLDVSKESLENVQRLATTLKRLLAPNLQLKMVPESLVASLDRLQNLDLSHNQLVDSSFPDDMKSLENLVEIRLSHNRLTKIPTCLRKMKNLARIDISDNNLDSASGLEKLEKLQVLVVDNNNLTSIFKDISSLRKLEILRCNGNKIRDVPRDIRNLRALMDLDVSDNRISVLPTDLFHLPRLDNLSASQNQIGKIPSFNVKVQNKHWISNVDLSENGVVKFPGHLMLLSEKLDLSCNKIRTLSWSMLKRLDLDRGQRLLLASNPLCYPPPDVCGSGLSSILHFFQEAQSEVKTYQGVKVSVVGSHRSGKSSLVHSLVDQQARLSDEMSDSSVGVDVYEMSFDYDLEEGKPGKSLNLCLWDFCGHPFYLYPHYLFHEQPSITILTFSIPDYTNDSFEEQIGSWFDWMITKTNKLVVILVGTKSDNVPTNQVKEIMAEVHQNLTSHLQARQTLIETKIKQIEQRPIISPALSEQLKAYMKLLQAKFTVQSEVIATSAKKFTGFDKLKEAVETLANDRKLFPNVMRIIPTFWVEVENWAEEKGNTLTVPVMSWEEFSEEVTQRFGMKHLLTSITQYLHETGKVLWFSNVPSLKNHVFLRPSWLFDVLKQIFHHELDTVAFMPDDTLKVIAFTPSKFERLKQELITEGVLDRELLKGLLVSLMPADLNKPFIEVLQLLTEGLEVGYPVTHRNRESGFNLNADKDREGNVKLNKLLIPWFRTSPEPVSFREKWTHLQGRRRLSVLFKFPCYMPPGLFELMTVRAHHDKHKLNFLSHWRGGLYANHKEEKLHFLLVQYQEINCSQAKEPALSAWINNISEETLPVERKPVVTKAEAEIQTTFKTLELDHTTYDELASASQATETVESHGNFIVPKITIMDMSDEVGANVKRFIGDTVEEVTRNGVGKNMLTTTSLALEVNLSRDETQNRFAPSRGDQMFGVGSPNQTNIVLKFELRDDSVDETDQTPAATMWNVLLPLLTDLEALLQNYTGVLVERRTVCPLCGEASFLGEWLTPKESQGLSTRVCESCNQPVDTAFLVQPREKKRVPINRFRLRHLHRQSTDPLLMEEVSML